MALYKATAKGNVPMSAQEEADIQALWNAENTKPVPIPKKTLDDRIADIEQRLSALEQPK